MDCNNGDAQKCGKGKGEGSGGEKECFEPRDKYIHSVDVVVEDGFVRRFLIFLVNKFDFLSFVSIQFNDKDGGELEGFATDRKGERVSSGNFEERLLALKMRCGHWIDGVF